MRHPETVKSLPSSLLHGLLAALALTLTSASAVAATVKSSIAYDTLGLDNTSWLAPASVTVSNPLAATASVDDLPPIPYYGYDLHHSTYLSGLADSNASGAMSSYVNMRAGGRLTAQSEWSDTVTNGSGTTQSYVMNFSIGGFGASLGGWTSDLAARDYRGAYEAIILVNGVSVWNSSQVFSLQNGLGSVSKSGTDIGTGTITPADYDTGYWQYALGGYTGTTALGSFAAGQSFNVRYVLRSIGYWSDTGGCSYECGSVEASIGDPFNAGGQGISIAAVPEPETWALMFAGLGLMGTIARRRRTR